MKNIEIQKGHELYDLILIPTIRIHRRYMTCTIIEFVWLKWYVGVRIYD